MTLFETISKRRSVRKFIFEDLDAQTLDIIMNALNDIICKVPFNGVKVTFKIEYSSNIANYKAPYYILAYCQDTPLNHLYIGYVLAQMDLFIQSIGLGSLFLGIAQPQNKEYKENYAMMLGFGKTLVPCRKSSTDFNRLSVQVISDSNSLFFEIARLAPSAMNNQPWKLSVQNDNEFVITYYGRGILKKLLFKKMSKIDLGIMIKYLEIILFQNSISIKKIIPQINRNHIQINILT